MRTLINWTAKRAGGRITVHGVDKDTHQPVKIVGVDMIEAGQLVDNDGNVLPPGPPVFGKSVKLPPRATDKNGRTFWLE